MQRHRKYLVVTIWISTIAFVGAGFVGWGQYSYGDKASAIARVGSIPITERNFQQAYGRLYAQYNQLFQGNFDDTRAKEFGLQQQALRSLIDAALILNLAKSLDLSVSDRELFDLLKTQSYFFKDGSFDKETYANVLRQNSMSIQEYEEDMRQSLLIQKIINLLSTKPTSLENTALDVGAKIADRISYSVLDPLYITVAPSEEEIKKYWEERQFTYMTLPTYTLEVLTIPIAKGAHTDEEIAEHHETNKLSFADSEGKLLALDQAKAAVMSALDDKAANKAALKAYIEFKKGNTLEGLNASRIQIDEQNHSFDTALYEELSALTLQDPYLKPRKVGDTYQVFKLSAYEASKPKSFEDARTEVLAEYTAQQKQYKLLQEAQSKLANFEGKTTDFLTQDDISKIELLETPEASDFLAKMFVSKNKRGFVELASGKVVLYAILEQKMLDNNITVSGQDAAGIKSMLLDRGLVQTLEKKFPTEIYVKGL
ncbi:MAG: SurA N-terminal domain-containing protein [Campylobacterales bacterium]|nr:SurA N-terminal domain-containing protein [Campylobacterales bacterium]